MRSAFLTLGLAVALITSCKPTDSAHDLAPNEFSEAVAKTPDAVLLDVRTPGEFNGGALSGAINVDFNGSDFESKVLAMDKSKQYFVYCLSGGRSGSAASWMRANGFNTVVNMSGGIMAWNAAGLPVSGGDSSAESGMQLADFNELVNLDSLILIDFYAPWCVPCKKMEPFLNELSTEYAGKVSIVRIDVDANKSLAEELGIHEIPVLSSYRNGKEVNRASGMHEKDALKKLIDAL